LILELTLEIVYLENLLLQLDNAFRVLQEAILRLKQCNNPLIALSVQLKKQFVWEVIELDHNQVIGELVIHLATSLNAIIKMLV
jgi:hypothetical protein